MGRINTYILKQLLKMFGFFALVLVLIYWINRAVSLFDRLIADGQSALVFLEFTSLTLPWMIFVIAPIAGFAAVIYV
ncbi:MAG: LptF/LptG family permease, partial [Planktomarina temperata]|nr:LptF/LptG family permease [Planktomarina temperata]